MEHALVKNFIDNIPGPVKIVGDGMSIGVLFSTLASWLPAGAALMTIVWTVLRIYEMKTVQNLLPCKKKKRRKTDEK